MSWFKKRKPPQPPEGDDWITVPFRFAEAARVSIYTIGSRPEIPDTIRWWIATWLSAYNTELVHYMQENYGPDIFPLLDRITSEVMPAEEGKSVGTTADAPEESWHQWERELQDGEEGNK